MGDLLVEPGGGAPLLGGLKVMKEGYEGGHLSSWGAELDNMEWACLPGTLGDG